MYEKSIETMLKLAVILTDSNWQIKVLDSCKGSDFVLRINGQSEQIEVVELDYCRASDLFLISKPIHTPYGHPVWEVVEFGACTGLSKVLCLEDSIQKWLPITIGECKAGDMVFFKPYGSREWRSQKFGTCPANGTLLCFNKKDGSWDEATLGSCRMNSTILHYKAKPNVDIEALIKQVEEE